MDSAHDRHNFRLVKLPNNIVKLASLATLNVSNNALTQLPQDVDLLVNLQYLDAGQCELRFLPSAVVGLAKLRVLDLCENYLTDLVGNIGSFSLNGHHFSQMAWVG